ncbi:MAG TPA: VacJ family lipoprotein [Smithellaceae bacterium]|nr:VacJ family lipoprotein [Smithellaceae bacterium]HPL31011.1 VacJ family lipoprotein [Smithellaceae bacterium]HQH00689.1 VacJ family lipoprotein [Smithellaceae bacterium]HQJ78729.1 VacJ family lipoprotein [Smithellaceae bacterium]
MGNGKSQDPVHAESPSAGEDVPARKDMKPSGRSQDAFQDEYKDEGQDYDDEPFADERVTIADPIEPFNRLMHRFNDRLYFWLLKPVAEGYKEAVPEPARISVKNFYYHLLFPIRFVNCVLQADLTGAGSEAGRFAINTVWGVGGLLDPSSNQGIELPKQNADFGQTLGLYGVGHGFYIVWPFLGPSSPRDSVDIAGEYVLDPLSYFTPWYTSLGKRPLKMINNASLSLGDYEAVIEAAIDPYIAIRNGYIQYRMKEVQARRDRSLFFRNRKNAAPEAADPPPAN